MKKIMLVLFLNIIVPSGPFFVFLEVNKSLHKKRKATGPIIVKTLLCTVMTSPVFILRRHEEERRIIPIWWALIIILMIIMRSNRK